MKIMAEGTKDAKGTSFMEDYTYNLVPGKEGILQAHMLEVCPSITNVKPAIKVTPLSMGKREDPARLVFTSKPGKGVATSLVDMGNRFRLIINEVECLSQDIPMPKLPVATAFWKPEPNLSTGAEAWILAGGAHHTAFSYDLTTEQMVDWAAAMGIESLVIDKDTTIRNFKNELRWNSLAFR
jgi:L-arabinose isomerase